MFHVSPKMEDLKEDGEDVTSVAPPLRLECLGFCGVDDTVRLALESFRLTVMNINDALWSQYLEPQHACRH